MTEYKERFSDAFQAIKERKRTEQNSTLFFVAEYLTERNTYCQ